MIAESIMTMEQIVVGTMIGGVSEAHHENVLVRGLRIPSPTRPRSRSNEVLGRLIDTKS